MQVSAYALMSCNDPGMVLINSKSINFKITNAIRDSATLPSATFALTRIARIREAKQYTINYGIWVKRRATTFRLFLRSGNI